MASVSGAVDVAPVAEGVVNAEITGAEAEGAGAPTLKLEDGFIYAVSAQQTNEYADPEVLARLQKEYGIFTDAETADYDEVMA